MIVTSPFSPGSQTQAQIDNVSRSWWVLFVVGVISVVAGSIIFFADWTVGDLAAFIGAILIIRGLFTMLSVPIDGAIRGWAVGLGLVEALVGLAVWVWPGQTLLVIAAFIGWYVLFRGVLTIASSVSGRDFLPYWGLLLALGIVETLLAFWLLAQPGLTLVAAVLAIGLWAMIYGVIEIVLSFDIRNMSSRVGNAARGLDSVPSRRRVDTAAG